MNVPVRYGGLALRASEPRGLRTGCDAEPVNPVIEVPARARSGIAGGFRRFGGGGGGADLRGTGE